MVQETLASASRNLVRVLTGRFRLWAEDEEPPPPPAPPPETGQPTTILDRYCLSLPSPQTALDIFAGEWSSKLPGEFEKYRAGPVLLFDDARIGLGMKEFGGVKGKHILELGPLEAGHTWMLERAGAASITAIEANTRAYLKCLIMKELLGMQRARFLCGDFLEYLTHDPPHYDLVLASGVLYHMQEPARLIDLMSRVADRLLIWTHYYDEQIIGAAPNVSEFFRGSIEADYQGFRHRLYRREYAQGLKDVGYCGGSTSYTHWMSRSDVLDCVSHFGFGNQTVLMDVPENPRGPSILFAARRTKPSS
jgi:Protein of unknown function (DUF1698)